MGGRRLALWIGWLGIVWLFAVFLASIVSYTRGIDMIAVLIGLLTQLTVVIAWTLWRPLPLWIVYFHALILLALVLGFVVTVPGALNTLSWMYIGVVPVGIAMIVAAFLHWERSAELTH